MLEMDRCSSPCIHRYPPSSGIRDYVDMTAMALLSACQLIWQIHRLAQETLNAVQNDLLALCQRYTESTIILAHLETE